MLTDSSVFLFWTFMAACFFIGFIESVIWQLEKRKYDPIISFGGIVSLVFATLIYYGLNVQTIDAVVFVKG